MQPAALALFPSRPHAPSNPRSNPPALCPHSAPPCQAVCMSHMPSRPFMLEFYGAVLERLAPTGTAAAAATAPAAASAAAASGATTGGAAAAGGVGAGARAGHGHAHAHHPQGELSGADFSRLLWSLSRVDCTPPRRCVCVCVYVCVCVCVCVYVC